MPGIVHGAQPGAEAGRHGAQRGRVHCPGQQLLHGAALLGALLPGREGRRKPPLPQARGQQGAGVQGGWHDARAACPRSEAGLHARPLQPHRRLPSKVGRRYIGTCRRMDRASCSSLAGT